jgi:multisubunit Na+/H+ antiporter MnhG subunit
MELDIRLPMGAFFALLGILLAVFGLAGNPAIYERSLGINVNLIWGLALVAFGIVMMILGRRGKIPEEHKSKN